MKGTILLTVLFAVSLLSDGQRFHKDFHRRLPGGNTARALQGAHFERYPTPDDSSVKYPNPTNSTLCPVIIQDPSLKDGTPLCLPYLIGIGTMKGGTSSLFRNLHNHPSACQGEKLKKEIGLMKARSRDLFKVSLPQYLRKLECLVEPSDTGEKDMFTFEITPRHMTRPALARWFHHHIPHVHIVVMLRDPILRAFSHYAMYRSERRIRKSFEIEIDKNLPLLQEYFAEQPWKHANASEFNHNDVSGQDPPTAYDAMPLELRWSLIGRGLYSEQLPIWFDLFPKNQMHVYLSEDLYADPKMFLTKLSKDIGLPVVDWDTLYTTKKFRSYSNSAYDRPKASTVAKLSEFYRPFNQRLSELLGVDVNRVWGQYQFSSDGTLLLPSES